MPRKIIKLENTMHAENVIEYINIKKSSENFIRIFSFCVEKNEIH